MTETATPTTISSWAPDQEESQWFLNSPETDTRFSFLRQATTSDDEVHFANDLFTWHRSDGGFFVGANGPADDPGAERLGIYYPRAGTLGGCSMHNAGAAVIP